MKNKTKDRALEVLKAIKAEIKSDVIKDYDMLKLCNIYTGQETGIAFILTLSTKYDYPSDKLEDWRKRLEAEDYVIGASRNQLHVRFNLMYNQPIDL